MAVTGEELLEPPLSKGVLIIIGVCLSCSALSVLISIKLAIAHLKKGQEMSGNIIPARRSANIAIAILAIPMFGVFAGFQLLTPEAMPVWNFLLTCVIAHVMLKIPTIYIDAVGGMPRLVKDIQMYNGDKLKLYGNVPLCCISPCAKPKMPELNDIKKLKLGFLQFSFIQPTLAFIELFITFEVLSKVEYARHAGWRHPIALALKIISNLVATSSCTGFGKLCEETDSKLPTGTLSKKKSYVQSFLLGMNLIPSLLHGSIGYIVDNAVVLHKGVKMDSTDQSHWSTAAAVCVASVYVARAAVKAFPLNDPTLYPPKALHEPML